ncbi:two pore domain potassium channel family protein, partial [Bacteroides thetaiotaomicron]
VLSVLLAALGMMMFPIFTVYITNLIQQSNQKKKQYYAEEEEKTASA